MNMKTKRINQRAGTFYDDIAVAEGPGLTRAGNNERTREFEAVVTQPGFQPMKITMRAASKTKARQYLQTRWPSSEVEVL